MPLFGFIFSTSRTVLKLPVSLQSQSRAPHCREIKVGSLLAEGSFGLVCSSASLDLEERLSLWFLPPQPRKTKLWAGSLLRTRQSAGMGLPW